MAQAEPAPEPRPDRSGPRHGRGQGARVWLVRHAQVHADWATRSYGPEDVPLSEEGLERTAELARSLAACRPFEVLSSDLSRAALLGRRVSELGPAPIVIDERLREVDRGRWRGKQVEALHLEHREELAAFYADPWSYRGHGGESDADVARRAWPALDARLDSWGGEADRGPLVVTAHYNVLRVLVSLALGLPPERSFAWRLDKGRASLLEDTATGWRLLAHNVHDPGALEVEDEHLGVDASRPTPPTPPTRGGAGS